ncbi:MAG: hypothetical protein ACK5TP_03970, partial [bacterium]
LDLIARHEGSVSIRDWQRLRSLARATDAEAELDALAKAEHGDWSWSAPGPRGGRPSRRFVLRATRPRLRHIPAHGDPKRHRWPTGRGSVGFVGVRRHSPAARRVIPPTFRPNAPVPLDTRPV